ncbi:MAG: hypothetical protein C6W59_15175 [Paenibacillaceae bacterium]|nr:MAG: hypothetical protein C6W59_15175 [Paenibacillaceae bacterium]
MNKRSKLPILAATTVMILALIGCSDTVTSNVERVETTLIGPESASGGKNIQERIFHADEFDRIDVHSEAMEVYVEQSPDDQITARLITDKAIDNPFVFDASIENGVLRLSVDEQTKINFLDRVQNGERKLILSLPDKPFKEVAIRNEFGSVDVADLSAGRVEIKLSAGDIRLSGVSGELALETEAGTIEAEGVTLDQDIFTRTSVGDIEVRFSAPPEAGSIRAKTTLGDVQVDIDGVQYSENSGNDKAGRLASDGHLLEAVSEVGSIQIGVLP